MSQLIVWQHVLPVIIIILCFLVGFIIKKTVLRRLSRLAKKSSEAFLDCPLSFHLSDIS